MKLNENIAIRMNNGVVFVKGKTVKQEPDFAITKVYGSNNVYTLTHVPTGMKCGNVYYYSTSILEKELNTLIENTKDFIKKNRKLVEKNIKEFKEIRTVVVPEKEEKQNVLQYSPDIKKYEKYAKERRAKSKIASMLDRENNRDREQNNWLSEPLNGQITADYYGNPYSYECTIGNGYTEQINGVEKRYTTSNMYQIIFYSGIKGVTIYKSRKESLHYYCFTCGGSPEIFGKDFFSAGCRVYEDLDIDQVVNLCNKNWAEFYNVKQNKNRKNYLFLKLMKERLIKTLEYNKIIFWCEEQGKYLDYNLKEFYK